MITEKTIFVNLQIGKKVDFSVLTLTQLWCIIPSGVICLFYNEAIMPIEIFSVSRLSWSASTFKVPSRAHAALVYRIKGSANFVFDNDLGINTCEGEIFYCPANVGYSVTYDDGEIIAIHFSGEGFGNSPEVIKASVSAKAQSLFERAYSVWLDNRRNCKLELVSVFFEILSVCYADEQSDARPESPFDKATRYFVDNAFRSDLLISDVCSFYYISESGFRKHFNTKYGMSPVKYITEMRLRRAEKLLIETDDTVESIAMQCGYEDVKYFCRVFYKHRRCTPTHFRRY